MLLQLAAVSLELTDATEASRLKAARISPAEYLHLTTTRHCSEALLHVRYGMKIFLILLCRPLHLVEAEFQFRRLCNIIGLEDSNFSFPKFCSGLIAIAPDIPH